MLEQVTIKERLQMFIKHLNIGQKKFEQSCGLSNGYVNNIRRSITDEKLRMISSAYPELNLSWLMLGDGDMLRDSAPAAPVSSAVGDGAISVAGDENRVNSEATLLRAIDEISEQRKLVAKSQEQIDRLLNIIERMNENIK